MAMENYGLRALVLRTYVVLLLFWWSGGFSVSGANLLLNGSFEEGLASWEMSGTAFLSTNSAVQGDQSLFVAAVSNAVEVAQVISTVPGRTYNLTFYYRPFHGQNGSITVLANDDVLGITELRSGLPPFDNWDLVAIPFTATGQETRVRLTGHSVGYLLDEVRVFAEPLPEPSEVRFAVTNVALEEGQTAAISVTRSGDLNEPAFVTVMYENEVGGTLSPQDFSLAFPPLWQQEWELRSLGLQFYPGQDSLIFELNAFRDELVEDTERGTFRLVAAGNSRVNQEERLHVAVSDAPPVIFVSAPEAVEESSLTAYIELVARYGMSGRVRVYSTSEGTAVAGLDFEPIDVVLTNFTSSIIPMRLREDIEIESEETIVIRVESLDGRQVENPVIRIALLDTSRPLVIVDPPLGFVEESWGRWRFPWLGRAGSVLWRLIWTQRMAAPSRAMIIRLSTSELF